MDYLFVGRNLAGLQKNTVASIEDLESKLSKPHLERIRKLSTASSTEEKQQDVFDAEKA